MLMKLGFSWVDRVVFQYGAIFQYNNYYNIYIIYSR